MAEPLAPHQAHGRQGHGIDQRPQDAAGHGRELDDGQDRVPVLGHDPAELLLADRERGRRGELDAAAGEEPGGEVGPLGGALVPGPGVDPLPGECGERHFGEVGERVVLGQDHGHRLVPHELGAEPRPQVGREAAVAAEGGVEVPGEDGARGAGEAALVAGHQFEVGGEFAGPAQDALVGEAGAVEVDQEGPGRGPEGLAQLVVGGEHAARVRQQALAVGGEGDLPGGPDEQLGAQLALQAPDVPAEGLLSDVEPGGGAGEVQLLGDGGEGAQEAGVGVVRGGHRRIQQHGCVNGHRSGVGPGGAARPNLDPCRNRTSP